MALTYRKWATELVEQVGKDVIGMDEVVRLCLVALCSGGHVLLEGNPGLAKTTLVKSLARELGLWYGRIQFTPDLMPADITGTVAPDQATSSWFFQPGPVFASLLLADEINRATPKTQSALLEAMAEGQVTVLGTTYRLLKPFMVLATQNPVDHVGTYQLPEAQSDRFMFKINMPIPDGPKLRKILARSNEIVPKAAAPRGGIPSLGLVKALSDSAGQLAPDVRVAMQELTTRFAWYQEVAAEIERTRLHPDVETHLVHIYLATNGRIDEIDKRAIGNDQRSRLEKLVKELVQYGLGPRAAIGLMKGAKAWALLFSPGSGQSMEADASALAHVLVPTLRHRLKLDEDWQQLYEHLGSRPLPVPNDPLAEVIADFCVNTAPIEREYRRSIQYQLAQALQEGI